MDGVTELHGHCRKVEENTEANADDDPAAADDVAPATT